MIKTAHAINLVDQYVIVLAQKKLMRLYERQRVGGWRAVMKARKLSNVSYVFDFVTYNIVPANPEIRRKLYLPRVLPSERKPRAKRELPKWGRSVGDVDIRERVKQ